MIFNFKRNSVIWQLTASFLLILLMPIMCNVLIYKEIRKDIRQELTEKNNIFFRNISKSIEISLKDYSQAVSELSVKPAVLNLCAAPSPDEITPELVNDFKDSLKPYYRTMYNAYKFYCCFNNSGMIGTTAGIEDKETFFRFRFRRSGNRFFRLGQMDKLTVRRHTCRKGHRLVFRRDAEIYINEIPHERKRHYGSRNA